MARGGSSNPMQDHHKKARQKELQRNKQRRTKERDEIALQTKTVREVKEEIQKLERDMKRHHHGQQQKSNAQHKMARLQKELTLLQEAEKAARAKADADAESYRLANKYRQPQRPLTELDDPRKSIYYDPVMNPYGAPPPGKPRLYHRRFGGVTPNPHEAVVPGEEPPPPPSRNAPPSHYRRQPNNTNNNQNYQNHKQQNTPRPPQNRQAQQQAQGGSSSQPQYSPKRQPLHMPHPRKNQSNSEDTKKKNDFVKTVVQENSTPPMPTEDMTPAVNPSEKPNNDKTAEGSTRNEPKSSLPPVIPSLPAPSAAVQRTMRVARNKTKRGKALADIWASTEEVEYERLANLVDLEANNLGTAIAKTKKKKKKKKKKQPLEFYYRDNSGTVQGPYSKAQMRAWIEAGYFPLSTKARTNRMDPDGWVPMGDLPALKEEPVSNNNNSVQDRIAALKAGGNDDVDDVNDMDASMQARIAAMRADLMGSSAPSDILAEEDSVQGRIAALRDNVNNDDEDGMDASMQARVAAMKADLMGSSAPSDIPDEEDSVQGRIAALRDNATKDDEDGMDASMQARIAAMRADLMTSSANSEKSVGEDNIQDRIDALRTNVDNNKEDEEVMDPSIKARIAAMRADMAGPSTASVEEPHEPESSSLQDRIAALRRNAPPPPAGARQQEEIGNTSVKDRIAALRQNAPLPPPPPPPAYAIETDNPYSIETGPPAYPVDDTGMAAYPVDNEDSFGAASYPTAYPTGDDDQNGVAAYPLNETNDDDNANAPYPAYEAYPGGESLAYPVTDSYPIDDQGDDPAPYEISEVYQASEAKNGPQVPTPSKKAVKVDKALVSFVPSNLQNKKRKAEEMHANVGDDKHLKKMKSPSKATTIKDDNYDKFLKEIDEL